MEYTGYSISTNNQLDALEAKHDLEVVQVRAEITAVQTEASDARAIIKADLSAETTRAVAKEAELEAKINTEIADRVSAVSAEEQARTEADSALDARLTSLEGWKTENTDALHQQIDDAVNSKVDQTLFDTVKTQLESSDSELLSKISENLVDRQNADATHREALTKSSDNDDKLKSVIMQMKNYLEAFSQTYTITDSNGNTVTADWSAMQGLLDGVQAHIVPAPAPSTV